jgi:MFS family permease
VKGSKLRTMDFWCALVDLWRIRRRARLSASDPASMPLEPRAGRGRDHAPPGRGTVGLRLAIFSPLAVVAAGLLLLNGAGIAYHLMTSAPKSPFDAGLTMVAARRLQGLPIYSDPVSDQASTAYGPIVPVITSWLFRAFGVSNLPGKLLSLSASLGVIAMVLAATARRDLRAWVVGAALLLACNHNVVFYFVEARPDMLALLFALVALVLFVRWERRGHVPALVVSLGFFILAFFAKQPLAAAALVPLVAEACRGGTLSRARLTRFGIATLPLVVVGMAIVCLRAASPMAYFYMIALPSSYPLSLVQAWHYGFGLLLMYASLLVVALDLAAFPDPSDDQARWWASAAGVFLAAGVVTIARAGSWLNSFLPFFIASIGLVTLRSPRAFALLDDATKPTGRRIAVSIVLALILFAFAIRWPGAALDTVRGGITIHGDRHHAQAVAVAGDLRGRVLCPEDPTIPLLARGETTRSIFFEMDATLWPSRLPAYVDAEIASARYVIQVKGPLKQLLSDDWLRRLGFAPLREDRLEGSVYHLWEKVPG